jgi:hypothetical protein
MRGGGATTVNPEELFCFMCVRGNGMAVNEISGATILRVEARRLSLID